MVCQRICSTKGAFLKTPIRKRNTIKNMGETSHQARTYVSFYEILPHAANGIFRAMEAARLTFCRKKLHRVVECCAGQR